MNAQTSCLRDFFLSFSLAYSGFLDVELLKGVHNGKCGAGGREVK